MTDPARISRLFLVFLLATGLSGQDLPREGGPWTTELGREHTLTGRIWDVRAGKFLSSAELVALLREARYVLLGEKHDNPDHHRLQAWTLEQLIGSGRRPAVALEMIDSDRQPDIDGHLESAAQDADGLGTAVEWDKSGWPDWSLYRPIVAAAVRAGLPVVAANLPATVNANLSREGFAALEPEFVSEFALGDPAPPQMLDSMRREIFESHCGFAREEMVAPMTRVQRGRDASMARQMLRHGRADGAVLIAGNGHTRTDRGVPYYLRGRQPNAVVASLGFLEVREDKPTPELYAQGLSAENLPFDFVWFTARLEDTDPCQKFRESLEKMKRPPSPGE